jgi:hypothetical protein
LRERHEREDAPIPIATTASAPDALDPTTRPWWIEESDAQRLFAVATRGQRYDPWTYHAALPSLDLAVSWPEHPAGGFRYRTNARSLREDAEVATDRGDLRVLVTGATHSAGFCDNADSFSNVLESRLARRFPERAIDVVNAANMGFSFHNYLGVLEKYRDLRPHVFVVAVHGGNDFQEVLLPHRYLERMPPREEDGALLAERGEAESSFPAALFQGVWSMASFRAHPEERALALAAAAGVFERIRAICADDGIELVVVLIPSAIGVERGLHAQRVDPVLSMFGLGDDEIAEHATMGTDLLRSLESASVTAVDATAVLRAAGEPSFWRTDLHLSLAGHARLAGLLEPVVVRATRFGG